MRIPIRLFSGFTLAAALLSPRLPAAEHPNIVYLMADDQNFGSIGIYGNPEVITPNMDKLGRDGVIFDRHYNATSICMASGASVMTGMYEFDDIYAGKTFTKPANFGRENGIHLAPQSRTGREYRQFTQWHYDTDYDGEMRKYYQQIYAIDVALGMIRDELTEQGLAANTVIIYTSDNGYFTGAHGLASKELCYEESARVPLMIYDPRSPSAGKNQRSPALTGNIDFAPTILDLAGLPIPANMDGVSLLPLLKDPLADVREQMAFMNVFGAGANTALTVLTKELKYTYWWYGDSTMQPTEELFHLTKDPLEMTNMVNNPEAASMLEVMRQRYDVELDKWKQEAVPYNNYTQYGELFDRTIPWEKKVSKKQGSQTTIDEE